MTGNERPLTAISGARAASPLSQAMGRRPWSEPALLDGSQEYEYRQRESAAEDGCRSRPDVGQRHQDGR